MPYTLNGFGTRYAGKKNRHQSFSTCEFCGYEGLLNTYDTRLCVSVVFLPLIPLRRKRVINECPKCRRHRVSPLKVWQKTVQEVIGEVTSPKAEGNETEAVVNLLGALVGMQAYAEFCQVADALEKQAWRHAEPLVALSEAWEHFLNRERAEAIMQRVVQMDPSPAYERRLFVLAALNGNFAYIQPKLVDAFRREAPDVFRVTSALQAMIAYGRSEEALEWIPRARDVDASKEFQEELDALEKMARRPKGQNANNLRRFFILKPVIKSESTFGLRFAAWAFPVLLLVVTGVVVMLSLAAKNAVDFTLINGLPVPYEVVINGESHLLEPNRRRRLTLPEGEIQVEMRNRDGDLMQPAAEQVLFRRGFFERISDSRHHILNPDRTAVLVRHSAEYRTEASRNQAREPRFSLHSGDVLASYTSDYFMRDLPNEIQLSDGRPTWKHTVTDVPFEGYTERFHLLHQHAGASAARAWVMRTFALQPNSFEILNILTTLLPPEEMVDLLQPYLWEVHPPKVEVHRYYQIAMGRLARESELEARYAEMLTVHPEDAALMYLHARATMDADLAYQRFQQVAGLPDAPPHVHNALAYHYAVRGEFAKAKDLVVLARNLSEDPELFEAMWMEMLWATEDWEPLLAHFSGQQEANPWSFESHLNYALVLNLSGQSERTGQIIGDYFERLRSPESGIGSEEVAQLHAHMRFLLAYPSEHFDPRTFSRDHPGAIPLDFMIGATLGDVAYCHAYMKDKEAEVSFEQVAVMAILTLRQGEAELAGEYLDQLEDIMSQTSWEIRTFLGWLRADEAPDADAVTQIAIPAELKKYLVAVLAGVFPESAEAYRGLQMKLNYKKVFPSRILESI